MRKIAPLLLLLSIQPAATAVAADAVMRLTSPKFVDGQPIPKMYTCEGDERSPPLQWTGAPVGTKAFALIVDDPDAPDPAAPKTTWVHWVLYNVPGTATDLFEGASKAGLPAGTVQGRNDFKRTNYGGPCPPVGRHHYHFKLSALDAEVPTTTVLDKNGLLAAMKGHVIAETELVGTYQKGDQ